MTSKRLYTAVSAVQNWNNPNQYVRVLSLSFVPYVVWCVQWVYAVGGQTTTAGGLLSSIEYTTITVCFVLSSFCRCVLG